MEIRKCINCEHIRKVAISSSTVCTPSVWCICSLDNRLVLENIDHLCDKYSKKEDGEDV